MKIKHSNTEKSGTFELLKDDIKAGQMTYTWKDKNTFSINHTEVNEAFQGQGLAADLLNEAIKYARENSLKIEAICSYVKSKFEKNKDKYADVIA